MVAGANNMRLADAMPRDWKLYDQGRTLIVLSVCIIGAMLALRLWRERALQTPSRGILILLGLAAYLSLVPATWFLLWDELNRGNPPWWGTPISTPEVAAPSAEVAVLRWGSSLITLPGVALTAYALMTLPLVYFLLWLSTWRAKLPSSFWAFNRARSVTSTVVTLVFGGAAVALIVLLIHDVWRYGSSHYILPVLCSIYVLLCMRAALLAPRLAPHILTVMHEERLARHLAALFSGSDDT
jgi:hypothetical protein